MQHSLGGGFIGGGNLRCLPLLAASALFVVLAALRRSLLLQDERDLLLHPRPDLPDIRSVLDAGQVVRRWVARQSDGVYFGEALFRV